MAERLQPKPGEVARISAEKDIADQVAMGLTPELAQLSRGAKWLIEHGGVITGHIDQETGDTVIDTHQPR